MALPAEVDADFYTDFAAADDHHVFTQMLGMGKGLLSKEQLFRISARDGQYHGGSASSRNDYIIIQRFDHLRSGLRVEMNSNATLLHLMDQEVLEITEGPLEIRKISVDDGATQLGTLLVDHGDMAPILEIHGAAHSCRTTANDGNTLAALGGDLHPVHLLLQTDAGVDRADGYKGIIDAAAMALVAAEAGHDVIIAAFQYQLAIIIVGNIGTGCIDNVCLAFGNGLVTGLGIVEAADDADDQIRHMLLHIFSKLQEGSFLELKADGMGMVHLIGAKLHDVDVLFRLIKECSGFFNGVSALQVVGGPLDLQEHVLTNLLTNTLQNHQRETHPVLQAAAKLVRPLIGQG